MTAANIPSLFLKQPYMVAFETPASFLNHIRRCPTKTMDQKKLCCCIQNFLIFLIRFSAIRHTTLQTYLAISFLV